MGYEGVNISRELTENEDHILALIIKKYIIGFKQTCIKNVNWNSKIISMRVSTLVCCTVVGLCVDLQTILQGSILLSESLCERF